MFSKSFYSTVLTLFFVGTMFAQTTSKIERAKREMKDLNYQGAIAILNSVMSKGDNEEAKIALAECYRKVNDSENAEFLYGQVVRLQTAQPIHYLYYGEMLQRNGKCELAREWFKKFAQAVPEDVRGQYQDRACDYEQELKTKGEGVYEVARTTFNSNLDDFGSAFYKNGIVFASERDPGTAIKRSHAWTGNPFTDLYFVPVKGTGTSATYGKPEKFSSDVNSKFHDAVVAFNKDQSQIYFTRDNYSGGKTAKDQDGIIKLKIYTSKKKGNGWVSEESLPFNSDEYSCLHPTLNAEGTKLYFASDMPGGFGGMDLYSSELENGRWGPPTNLGPGINTEGNEVFPFIYKNNRLYFSSDGQIGLGGFDIYYTDAKAEGQWGTPENIGAPINSKDDDIAFTLSNKGESGYFTSNRTGGAGRDDIYSFTRLAAPVRVYVYDEKTKEPIEGATVTSDSCFKRKLKTGKDGRAMIDVKFGTCCTYVANAEGYDKNSQAGCVKDATSNEDLIIEIPMKRENKFNVEGIVFDQITGLPLPDVKVSLMNSECKDPTKTFTTDATGRYNFMLDNLDCCYKIRAEKDKYFAVTTPDTVCTKGLKENKTYQVNLNLQPTQAPLTPPQPGREVTSLDPKNGKMADGRNTTAGMENTPGALNNATKKPGKIVPVNPNTVYYDAESNLYLKKGKPFTGKYNGVKYKEGLPVEEGGSTVFTPSATNYPNDSAQAYLLHVYYDFDQSYLRAESTPELEKLLKLMKDNPSQIIEISSHTDARGSNSYNNRLSQRRAESVVRWLSEHGVDRDRLVPRGYGESMSTNKCVNNVPCTEREHQMNRRTEFRVLGCKDCIDDAKRKLSRPNEHTKVDKCQGCPF